MSLGSGNGRAALGNVFAEPRRVFYFLFFLKEAGMYLGIKNDFSWKKK